MEKKSDNEGKKKQRKEFGEKSTLIRPWREKFKLRQRTTLSRTGLHEWSTDKDVLANTIEDRLLVY
jgi:hypothetical protein